MVLRLLYSLFPVLLAATLLGACETVVDVTPPPHDPKLVAQGFFTPDSLWVVRVSHTVPYAAPEAPELIDDATVEIWTAGQLHVPLSRVRAGTYVATGQGPERGKTYTLRVAAPGYPPTEGSDALPAPLQVAAFKQAIASPATSTATRRRVIRIEVTLDDPPGIANYYGLLVVQARWREDRRTGQFTPLPPGLFPFESDDLALGESAFDVLDTDKTLYREAFFSDGLFDGSAYTLDLDVQYDEPRPDAGVAVRRVFAVVLLTVSEDFFRYWKTAGRQAFTNENPFAEPLRVHSNMTGGSGIFAGFRYRVFPLAPDSLAGVGLDRLCSLLSGRLPICIPPVP